MRNKKSIQKVTLSLITSALLIGCGGDANTPVQNNISDNNSSSNSQKLLGSVVKGAIDGATITIYDKNGKEIAKSNSKDGKFDLSLATLTSEFYTIKSSGGTYIDEATKKSVTIPTNSGLETLLTKDELKDMIAKQEFSSLTPETTIFTELVKDNLKDNNLSHSIMKAEDLLYKLMIKDSSPMPNLKGDSFIRTGDLTKAVPSNTTEAFAKNRAISFSNLTKSLGLEPVEVFDIITKLEEDYKDGKADRVDINGKDINITREYALARTRLFEDTTSRLRDGNLSQEQIKELQTMGFDVKNLTADKSEKDKILAQKISKYLTSTTLPTLHILPTMSDEDGNSKDSKETYTLTANRDVNVTIETPDGSWITPMWRYNNNPLPLVIRANRGDAMTLNFNNKLNADSTIHWHGFKIPAIMDGGPDMPVKANDSKAYKFTMNQPASPLWFHPHPDMQTGKQVYMGLAGAFLVEDDISKKLEVDKKIPSGDKDIVLLVQDRRFGKESNGVRNLLYKNKAMDSDGMKGSTILVNGSVMPKQEVSTTKYRLRLYNVSNAKTYDFAFNDGRKFTIIGTDGGLLNKPVEVDHIMLGAAQRVELVVDFSQDSVGSKLLMLSRPYKADMMGMMGGDSNKTTLNMEDNGMGLTIMRFDVTKEAKDEVTLYTSLPSNAEIATRLDPTTAVNATNSRKFVMSMYNGRNSNGMNGNSNSMNRNSNGMNRNSNGMNGNSNGMNGNSNGMNGNSNGMSNMNMVFAINGKIFDPNRVDEFVGADTTEIWEIKNMSPMAHPFHAHAIQYQILERNGIPATGIDLGWKDTFLVQPGESVKIIGKFEAINQGDYMYHCHILEHEDAGMMGYFRVGNSGHVGN